MAVTDYLDTVINDRIIYTQNNAEVHFNCPMCGEHRHRMYVNLSTHKTYCHNCGWSGTLLKLIQVLEGVSFEKARSIYKDVKGTMYIPDEVVDELYDTLLLTNVKPKISLRPIPLPEEYVKIDSSRKVPIMQQAIKALHKRAVSDNQIDRHKMGVCYTGNYANRIIIPIYEENQLRFWVARAISKNAYRKEMSPSNLDYQISKSQVIFNISDASKLYNAIVISEGIYDATAWGDIGVSLLGKQMSDEQLSIILSYKEYLTEGVYLCLDEDARANTVKVADELSMHLPVKLIQLPKGYDDPNFTRVNFGKKFMYNLIDKAVEYDNLYKLKTKFFV